MPKPQSAKSYLGGALIGQITGAVPAHKSYHPRVRILIVGCGYVGLPLGRELVQQNHEVFGLRRGADTDAGLKAAGLQPLVGDITQPAELARLPSSYDWVVNCVSSSGGSAEDYRAVYLQGTRNLLGWLSTTPPTKFVYTSSTSVYGQTDGSWVEETSPTEPEAETAKVLVETEKVLFEAAQERNFPAEVLRVAGIYGPGRRYWLKQFLKGEARIEGKGERLLNMIHRDDVAGAIMAALQHGQPGQIYNAVDDDPVTQLALFQWLSAKLGRELPPFVAQSLRERGTTNKRVSNRKLKDELGYRLKYPTFREGYAAEV
jgi:nucleoside-diphosphate-sugar epimerase